MLKTLMDVTEAETGMLKLDRRNVDLTQLLREVIDLYDCVAQERLLTVQLDAPTPCPAFVDPIHGCARSSPTSSITPSSTPPRAATS
jgi:signal transduction histidine kinase